MYNKIYDSVVSYNNDLVDSYWTPRRRDEPPRWKDPLEQRIYPRTVPATSSSFSTSLSSARSAYKRNSYMTDQVMDIFGLHVPESNAQDDDLDVYLRRLRRPAEPDLKQIEQDLEKHKQVKEELLREDMALAPPPVRRHNPTYTSPKARPSSLISSGPEFVAERNDEIEQTARFLQRRKQAWKY